MRVETRETIAIWAYPDEDVEILTATWIEESKQVCADVVMISNHEWFEPEEDAEQHLHLQDMYREWLMQDERDFDGLERVDKLWRATGSAEDLLIAIARDILGLKGEL